MCTELRSSAAVSVRERISIWTPRFSLKDVKGRVCIESAFAAKFGTSADSMRYLRRRMRDELTKSSKLPTNTRIAFHAALEEDCRAHYRDVAAVGPWA
eukprot:m.65824 g.65824  ORF g.65824 m.65824 type:complete len:98 (-) comp14027_c0_seq62:1240-1533(-)